MMPFAIRHPVTAMENDTEAERRRRRSSSVKQALSSFFTGERGSEEAAEMDRSGPQGRRASTPGLEGTTRRVARRFSSPARADSRPEHRAQYTLGDEGLRWSMEHGVEDMYDEGTLFGIEDVGPGSCAEAAGCGGLDSREFLTEYLAERGFVQQRTLLSKGDVAVYALTSGEIVFLPTASSLEEGYLRNIRQSLENGDAFSDDYGDSHTVYDDPEAAIPDSYSATSLDSDVSESAMPVTQLTTELLDDATTLFNLAVVVSIAKPVEMSEIKARLFSRVRVHWHNGLPPGRRKFEEYYTIGDLKWTLTAENYNLYVPLHVSTEDQIIERSTGVVHRKLFRNVYERDDSSDRVNSTLASFMTNLSEQNYTFKPGDYVFILPVQFIRQVPETIYVPSARLNYDFCCGMRVNKLTVPDNETIDQYPAETTGPSKCQKETDTPHKLADRLIKKVKARLTSSSQASSGKDGVADTIACGSMPVTVVRTPPLRSISIADKPIYINRVWTNALSYEISLLQKYVPLDSEIPLKIKLVPLMKHVSVKRIRINISEKITLVSKDLKYEFDQMDVILQDPYNPLFPELQFLKKPARSLPLLEVRTKDKGIKALREEVIENSTGDNLLCYSDAALNSDKGVEMVDSLTLETTLKFPKFTVPRKNGTMPPYGIEELVPSPDSPHTHRPPPSHGVLGLFGRRSSGSHPRTAEGPSPSTTASSATAHSGSTFRTGSRVPIEHSTFLNVPKRGLYADSTHFKHIVVKHKLEVMLRVSKRDSDADGAKLRHYEVLIDTPIVLLSEYCSRQNVDLPTYNMVTGDSRFRSPLPTFEEAVSETLSAPDSPITSPLASPDILASYDPDEFSIQQLSLSRTTTHTQADPLLPADFSPLRRYSNIDEMMRSSSSNTASADSRCPAYSADPPTYEDT
ncbi:FADR065Wp [Eremothecium gossypii FDAG1]|nr:FADR065Wp [Eremothecium gossypii FDAG1]